MYYLLFEISQLILFFFSLNGHFQNFNLCFATLSPAENKFDLELSSKVFFFTELCSVDLAFEESE